MRAAFVSIVCMVFAFACVGSTQSTGPAPSHPTPSNPPPSNPPPHQGGGDDPAGPGGGGEDGASCSGADDCKSHICEGEGCGPGGGKCAPASRACTRDLRQYCGC